MATALDIVSDALRELGVLAAGEVATAEEAASGLAALNRLVDQWAAERLAIYEQERTTFTVAAYAAYYLVGTGQTVNVARPMYLDHVNYYDSSVSPTTEIALERMTLDGWAANPQKALTANAPTNWYYEPDYPYGRLIFWPIPTTSTLYGVVYHPKAVSEYASLGTAVALPPGYRRMMVKNLALEMAPSYSRRLPPELVMQADDAVRVVKRSNHQVRDLGFEFTAQGAPSYDIEEG